MKDGSRFRESSEGLTTVDENLQEIEILGRRSGLGVDA